MNMWAIWLLSAAILLIIELLSNIVATLCLAVGCICALIPALCGASIGWQLAALVAGSILAFIFLAPVLNRLHLRKRQARHYNSNMEALIGRTEPVKKYIGPDGALGRVRIDGDYWQAKSKDGRAIEEGTLVRVVSYDSIILTVEPVNN